MASPGSALERELHLRTLAKALVRRAKRESSRSPNKLPQTSGRASITHAGGEGLERGVSPARVHKAVHRDREINCRPQQKISTASTVSANTCATVGESHSQSPDGFDKHVENIAVGKIKESLSIPGRVPDSVATSQQNDTKCNDPKHSSHDSAPLAGSNHSEKLTPECASDVASKEDDSQLSGAVRPCPILCGKATQTAPSKFEGPGENVCKLMEEIKSRLLKLRRELKQLDGVTPEEKKKLLECLS